MTEIFPAITNLDDERRQAIIRENGGEIRCGWRGQQNDKGVFVDYDILPFRGLTAKGMATLISEGFADSEDAQNCAPTYKEIMDFIEVHPDFTAHGYIVTPERDDYRVTVEGVAGYTDDCGEERAFAKMFRRADEYECNEHGDGYCRAWYD